MSVCAFSLSRQGSLRHERDVARCLRRGRKHVLGNVEVWLAPAAAGHSRLAVSVGRKAGKAHDRNRLKRQLRHAATLAPPPAQPLDMLLACRKKGVVLRVHDLSRELGALFARALPPPAGGQ